MASGVEPMRCYRHPDRETLLSCSECGRPICTDCMTVAPVGLRCPEHSGKPQGMQRVTRGVRRATYEGTGAVVTRLLIALNVGVYLAELASGADINGVGGSIFRNGYLYGPYVADGDWWRLITSNYLHYGPIHLGMNMVSLWILGGPLETMIGRGRFLLLYVVSGLAGSAGALLWNPDSQTVGASGAIFGIIGAVVILERQGTYVFAGSAMGLLVANLVFTFAFASFISVGGHLGGLTGGALGTLALSRLGRGHAAYSRVGAVGIAALVAIGVASVAIAFWAADRSKPPPLVPIAAALREAPLAGP
jgi:membrane associated rhomboid family serine protease